jgi:sec-independent protein translocase protein TatC
MEEYFSHLNELRNRLIRIIIYFLICFPIVYLMGFEWFWKIIINPIKEIEVINLIVLEPLEYVYFKLKFSFLFSIIILMPLLIFEILGFIFPGLNRKEKIIILSVLPLFSILSAGGFYYSYLFFLPFINEMLVALNPESVKPMFSVMKYAMFFLTITIISIVLFQIPILMLLINRIIGVSKKFFLNNQKNIIVIALIAGAFFTPPDVITQIMFAIPFILFYEIGIFMLCIAGKK